MRGFRGRLTVALFFVLGTLASAPVARAQDDVEAAKSHYTKGSRYYEVGDYRDALAEFRAAHLAKSDPAFLYNIAQCQRQLGDIEQAVVMYKRYLAAVPKAANRDEVERRVADLEASLAEKRKQASVAPAPATPPVSVPVPAPAPAALQGETPAETRSEADITKTAPSEPSEQSALRTLRWVGAGLTVGLAGGAIATGLSATSKYNSLRDSCGKTAAGCASSDIDSVKSRALLANVLWGAAGAAALVTGVFFYLVPGQASVQMAWRY